MAPGRPEEPDIADIQATLGELYGAVAAHLRVSEGDESVLVRAAAAHQPEALAMTVAVSIGEQFRRIAAHRGLTSVRLGQILDDAYAELDSTGGPTGALLATARAHLRGDEATVCSSVGDVVRSGEVAEVVRAGVALIAEALRWRASDEHVDPSELATTLCLSTARVGGS